MQKTDLDDVHDIEMLKLIAEIRGHSFCMCKYISVCSLITDHLCMYYRVPVCII